MNITKALAQRIFGKMKQDKTVSYKFHISITQGIYHKTRAEVLQGLLTDIKNRCNKYGVKVDVINEPASHALGGATIIVRDHRAVSLLAEACNGRYKGKIL